MRPQIIAVFVALAVVLGIPFALRPAQSRTTDASAVRLIIVTPHIEQIRIEFAEAFDAWHRKNHGTPAVIDWRTPGGTSEIIKQLEAQYTAALAQGRYEISKDAGGKPEVTMAPGTVGYDLMFGGGSFDHGRLKTGVAFINPESKNLPKDFRVPMAAPAGFTQAFLDEAFGANQIGAQQLYDPDQYWIGTALSSFGIVYNRDLLTELSIPEPDSFEDLTDPRYFGLIALADPRQSGSITTTFDSILNNKGWDQGWKILREIAANTRYFTNSAPKPPIDISAGEAAAGLAIDFYGRGQAQYIGKNRDGKDRLGYVDPVGATYIDADPITLLRGAPHPDLAKRFIAFCLTEEAQALWNFAPRSSPTDLGPRQHVLRRMPVRRMMYEKHADRLVDRGIDPFAAATQVKTQGWRSGIGLMMGAFSIDIADDQREAWRYLIAARNTPSLSNDSLVQLEQLFYAWPTTPITDGPNAGKSLDFTAENFRTIRNEWRNADTQARLRIGYTTFFRSNYRQIVAQAESLGVKP